MTVGFCRRLKNLDSKGDCGDNNDDTKTCISLNLTLEGFPNISKITDKEAAMTEDQDSSFDSISVRGMGEIKNDEQTIVQDVCIQDLCLRDFGGTDTTGVDKILTSCLQEAQN